MSYIDTNILISYINPNDPLHDDALRLLGKVQGSRIVSDLSVIELYSVFSRTMNLNDIELHALVKYTLRKTDVQRIRVRWEKVFKEAEKNANLLKLKTLDLLHITVAILTGCKYFVTFDKDILSKSAIIGTRTNMKILH